MKVVGLCGQSGAGKGLVCAFFSELNIKCIDTDRVYHDIISTDSECARELVAFFGCSISANPGINRKELARVAFISNEYLEKLNEITHKHILNDVRTQIHKIKSENRYDGIIIDAPLLFESGFDAECDATIAVISSDDNKLARIMERDGIDEAAADLRIKAGKPDEFYVEKSHNIVYNDCELSVFNLKIQKLLNKLLEENENV